MGRKITRGLDYTFLDKDFFFDRKVKRLQRKCGKDAPFAFIALLCLIMPDGYYIKYDNDLVYDIADMTGFDEDRVATILETCGEVGLLDEFLMETEGILTSRGIQKHYASACVQMKRKHGVEEYSLLDDKISSGETPCSCENGGIFSEETPVNSEETPISSGKKPTNKIKENKRNYSSSPKSSSSFLSEEEEEKEKQEIQEFLKMKMGFASTAELNAEFTKMVDWNNTAHIREGGWKAMNHEARLSAARQWSPRMERGGKDVRDPVPDAVLATVNEYFATAATQEELCSRFVNSDVRWAIRKEIKRQLEAGRRKEVGNVPDG